MNCSSHQSNIKNQKKINKELTSVKKSKHGNQNICEARVSDNAGSNASLSWDNDAFEIEEFDKALDGLKIGINTRRTSWYEVGSDNKENDNGDVSNEDW